MSGEGYMPAAQRQNGANTMQLGLLTAHNEDHIAELGGPEIKSRDHGTCLRGMDARVDGLEVEGQGLGV